MPTLESLGFEIERRVIIFHRDTSMPDGSQLGYTGNPNDVVDGNTPGESLLYNCPSGTKYLDKSQTPHKQWEKVDDGAGGLWIVSSAGSTTVSGGLSIINFSGNKLHKRRYLNFEGRPSSIIGFPVMFPGNISAVYVNSYDDCSGWVRIQKNMSNFYSVQMVSQKSKLITGISRSVDVGDTIHVKVESSNGINYPNVQVQLLW